MNPVLIKPSGNRKSQVLVMGKPYANATARSYQELKHELKAPVVAALDDLRARFDVVVCEGAGSPAEINLRQGDLANMGLARAANLPVAGHRRHRPRRRLPFPLRHARAARARGPGADRGLPDQQVPWRPEHPRPGLDMLKGLTGRDTYGVLPWLDGPFIDAEDSLALRQEHTTPGTLDVAVIRLRWMSNFTDVDALAGRARRLRPLHALPRRRRARRPRRPARHEGHRRGPAAAARRRGLDVALQRRTGPILGICGGYQMLGHRIEDGVGVRRQRRRTRPPRRQHHLRPEKLLRRVTGTVLGLPATGYEIRHGRVDRDEPLIQQGDVLGTAWHGLLEGDDVRRALLSWVAQRTGRDWTPGTRAFADVREAHLDRLADWFGAHVDAAALTDLITNGAPEGLPHHPARRHRVLRLLTTADTEILAAHALRQLDDDFPEVRCANPSTLEDIPAFVEGARVVVVRLLGGRRAGRGA